MLLSLSILALFMVHDPATAGNVKQQPDPELLKRFEAERDAARAGQQRAQERIRVGEEKIRQADEMERQAHEEAVRELCKIGALPASECP